jgi:hypothetical protein
MDGRLMSNRPNVYICAMQLRKSHILLLLAYGLALLHSTIPHQHASLRTAAPEFEVRTISDFSLFGLLQTALATDLGCGHLESFTKSDDGADVPQTLSYVPVVFFSSLYFAEQPVVNAPNAFGAYIEKLHTRILLQSSRQFRAPPFLA